MMKLLVVTLLMTVAAAAFSDVMTILIGGGFGYEGYGGIPSNIQTLVSEFEGEKEATSTSLPAGIPASLRTPLLANMLAGGEATSLSQHVLPAMMMAGDDLTAANLLPFLITSGSPVSSSNMLPFMLASGAFRQPASRNSAFRQPGFRNSYFGQSSASRGAPYRPFGTIAPRASSRAAPRASLYGLPRSRFGASVAPAATTVPAAPVATTVPAAPAATTVPVN